MAVILGLHVNIHVSQLPDPALREHRNRVFWTAFILDRLWACKLGCPPALQYQDIQVDLPTDPPTPLPGSLPDDFVQARYVTAYVKLTLIMNKVVRSIYGKDKITTLFNKVQKRVLELKDWVEELPQSFRISTSLSSNNSASSYHRYDVLSLHMTLNQVRVNPLVEYHNAVETDFVDTHLDNYTGHSPDPSLWPAPLHGHSYETNTPGREIFDGHLRYMRKTHL